MKNFIIFQIMFSSHLNPIPHLHNILDEVLVMETARGLMTVDVYPGGTSPRPWFLSIGGCCCSMTMTSLFLSMARKLVWSL